MPSFSGPYGYLYVLPILLFFILIEAFVYERKLKTPYPWRDCVQAQLIYLGYKTADILTRVIAEGVIAFYVWEHRLFDLSIGWFYYPVFFFVTEFAYYWYHRISHERRYLWASHSVHHTPNEVTLSASFLAGWTPLFSLVWVFYLPVIWLGFPPRLVFLSYVMNLTYQFWIHTQFIPKLGWLEGILNTPSAHRVHHGVNPEYINRNYGGVLVIFDRFFGTYAREEERIIIRYGLLPPISTRNPLKIVFCEWQRLLADIVSAKTARERAGILFGRTDAGSEKS